MTLTRRRLLIGAGITGTAALAGCLDDQSDPGAGGDPGDDETDDTDDTNDGENGSDDTEEGSENDGTDGTDDTEESEDEDEDEESGDEPSGSGTVADYDAVEYTADGGETAVETFRTRDEAESYLGLEDRQETERDAIESLLDDVDFDAETVLALETQGTNGCYALQLRSLEATDEDGLSVSAAAVDTSDDDEACTQQLVDLGLLVRVTYDGEPPSQGSAAITDGDGDAHEFAWASDTASDGEDSSGND
ncbi:hypothetical protein [Natronosalvus vescus]|uniref:hypothetical protein n=1 Tax=Natronosalvus vescus TaxID=2953881 RepID=UPI0020911C21|nr:hypothetical protein [Natronosalvus vescus]